MKHHCHCGLEKHLQRFRVKRFGILGVVLMGVHVLFHVVECLVVPAIIMAVSGHAVEERAAAADESVVLVLKDRSGSAGQAQTVQLVDFERSLWGHWLEL